TIFRALITAVLLLFGYVIYTGTHAGESGEALGWHLSVGLVTTIVGALAMSVPFAYFLGTGFWVKAFVRASRAGPEWEQRHALWMKGRAYPVMYIAPLCTVGTAISGSLVQTARLGVGWHIGLQVAAALSALVALVLVPREMLRNSALMDQLADEHQVPQPETPAAEELIAEESAKALPPLFQLSRILMYAGVQLLIIWVYLRFGTEGWRETPLWPFGAGFAVLLTLGMGLNARFDPDNPRAPARAWSRAVVVGVACAAVVALIPA
ncbi:MAG: hypothetical protein ACYTCU_11615, partial [Planctomycetota bacterium]